MAADGTVTASPTAELPGDAAAGTPAWQSSSDAPTVQVAHSWITVTASDPAASGEVFLKGASLFGGELTLGRLHVLVSQTAAGQQPPTVDLRLRHLVIDGTPVAAPKPGDQPLALGDWGTLTVAAPLDNQGVAGVQIDVTADHDGVSAIVVPVDRESRVGGYDSWWNVPVAEVSDSETVREARAAYDAARRRERDFL